MKEIITDVVKLPNKEEMFYRHKGKGNNNLLLIHGNQSSSLFYEELMNDLPDDINIYAIDLMGFGNSSYKNKHISINDWAEDVKEFMDLMNIDKATVVGWSLGGGVSMQLSASYPKRVSHLVLLASVGVKGYPMFKYDKNLKPILSEPIYLEEDIVKDPVLMVPVMNGIKNQDRDFFKMVWRKTIFNLNEPEENLFNAYMDEILKERCFLDVSVALINFNITDEKSVIEGSGEINNIDMPVTWIHGKKDMVVPIETGKDSYKYFKNKSNFVEFENSGHCMFMDEKQKFIETLENILKKN